VPTLSYQVCGGSSSPTDVRATRNQIVALRDFGVLVDVYSPKPGSQTRPCPVLIVLPPGCSLKEDVNWAGPSLAALGYIVAAVGVSPTGSFGLEMNDCAVAASTVLDYLGSASNPYRSDTDTARVGAIGYSLSARTVVRLQAQDRRFKAIVAWDNLPKSDLADPGSPSCAQTHDSTVTPRAPALGIASERCVVAEVGADAKTTGMRHWRAAAMPAVSLTLHQATHGAFSAVGDATHKPYIVHYTARWFDRWLKGDSSATVRLLADPVMPPHGGSPVSRSDLLSRIYRSAVFLDGRDCPDVRAGCS
jgi:dienelactone hydrolase